MLVISADPKKKKLPAVLVIVLVLRRKGQPPVPVIGLTLRRRGQLPGCQWPTHRVFLYLKPTFDRAACSGLLVSPGS